MSLNDPIPQEQWIPTQHTPYTQVAPGYLKLVTLTTLLVGVIPVGIALALMMVVFALALPWLLAAGLVLTVLLALWVYLSQLRAKRLGYMVREQDLVVRRGIFWQRHTCLTLSRLQHVTLSQGPLDRFYGLATLRGFTAGSPHAEITIPGLPSDQAEQLRQHLMAKAGTRHES
ncbi:PH domain-containing protein [Ferrimonas futtsuensis]|uniref:PH domain-containing protein n=1 Tax=Ferrimonas futtsuensis TaxID=364764 RepID=UPI00146C0CA9|nr:PH domain-containing protein [Ferrimonas futtsuensis]